jgi:predicted GNAT superfamily acetyltransferase
MNVSAITCRVCESEEDYAGCISIQRDTWGADDVVPAILLKASQKVGGVTAGAFDADGRMVGCVYGVSGVRGGRLAHWSHMLAVVREARGQGIGNRLKQFQRELLLTKGVEDMYWTFDPLESVNAHFNVNRLGARPVEYVEDMYGHGEGNPLHQGLGTDRFIVYWNLKSPAAGSAEDYAAPVLNEVDGRVWQVLPHAEAPRVRVEVPRGIQELKHTEPDTAMAWRLATREAFRQCLAAGYTVTGFTIGDRSLYQLELQP